MWDSEKVQHDDREHKHSGVDLVLPLAGEPLRVMLLGGFGGLYGAAEGTLTFPLIGTVVGLFFGALSGAVVGLPLGLLDTRLLSWLNVSHRKDGHLNPRGYRLQAGIVCTAGNLLALMLDWALHDLPDPNNFATDRASYLVLDLFLALSDRSARVPTEAVILVVWVLVPLLMILLASWLTGSFVAGWYERTISQM